MGYKNLKYSWFTKRYYNVPGKYLSSFLKKTGFENLKRLRLVASAYILILLTITVVHIQGLGLLGFINSHKQVEYDFLLVIPSFIILLLSYINNPKNEEEILPYHRIIILFGSMLVLSGVASFTGMQNNTNSGLYFAITLFAVSLIFYFRILELIILYLVSVLSLLITSISLNSDISTVINIHKYLVIYMPVVILVSRIFYSARINNFITWKSLTDINQKLKNEIAEKERVAENLIDAKNNLELRVNTRTSELKYANIELTKEIAERKYADKIKSVLYNISNLINRTNNLNKLFAVIHNELRSVMDVKNFLISQYDSKKDSTSIIFHLNDREEPGTFEIGKSLTAYVISNRKSVLVSGKEINDMLDAGEVDVIDSHAHSWLGVPLFIKGEVFGVVIVQTYEKDKWYTKMDKEVLEFIGEHIATAIEHTQTENRLLEAKERAEESDKLKTSFLANMSHEIRTPMNAIVGFSDLLSDDDITKEERVSYTHYIKKSSKSLLRILEDIIVIARLQSNLLKPVLKEFSLNKFILDLNSEFCEIREQENKSGISLIYHIPDSKKDIKIVSDEERIKQVYLSLIHNSFKFTDYGQIEYGYTMRDNNIEFFVKDTGIGLDKEKGELIFDIFRQVDESTTRQYGGTGLGLAIAKGIVDLLGGSITFSSKNEVGTTFFFVIPGKK